MSVAKQKSVQKLESNCPLNSDEIDLVPECYHSSNRCLCFTCTCGLHICPSLKRTFYAKGSLSSNYQRSYSKPLVSKVPQRVHSEYHPNTAKMDLKSEYQKQYPGFTATQVSQIRSKTPQPPAKFEGVSQYNRDFPNWGPVDYYHNKRPVQPTHHTQLKFCATSSYGHFFDNKSPSKNLIKTHNEPIKEKIFAIPLESTTQREYKKVTSDHFAKIEPRKIDEYVPLMFNPHQFNSISKTDYGVKGKIFKDPMSLRKEIIKGKIFN